MIELIVLYRMPNDPERFDKYYRRSPRADDQQTART